MDICIEGTGYVVLFFVGTFMLAYALCWLSFKYEITEAVETTKQNNMLMKEVDKKRQRNKQLREALFEISKSKCSECNSNEDADKALTDI